jgi:hypothetical protein
MIPPPPPPSWPAGGSPSLPPPPPAGAPFGAPTPGYLFPTAVLGASPTNTGGLRRATIILYWCTAGAAVLLAAALVSRKVTWEGLINGDRRLSDVEDADDFVGAAAAILILLAIATVIVLSIWSLRTARHARATGAADVSPGLSCGGWYIPFGNLFVPFVQLRRVAVHRRRRTTMVSAWQGLAIGSAVVSIILRAAGDTNDAGVEDISGRLTAQAVTGVLLGAAAVVTAYVASRALQEVDAVR